MIARSILQTPQGQLFLTYPKKIAEELGIKKGDLVECKLEDGKMIVTKIGGKD